MVLLIRYYGPYWALPSHYCRRQGWLSALRLLTSCSSLGGFLINKSLGFVSTIMVRQEYLL